MASTNPRDSETTGCCRLAPTSPGLGSSIHSASGEAPKAGYKQRPLQDSAKFSPLLGLRNLHVAAKFTGSTASFSKAEGGISMIFHWRVPFGSFQKLQITRTITIHVLPFTTNRSLSTPMTFTHFTPITRILATKLSTMVRLSSVLFQVLLGSLE